MTGHQIDLTMNTLMHGSIKRELDRIRSGVLALGAVDGGNPTGLVKRWAFYSEQLQAHHLGEDRYIWPVVRERAKQPAEVVVVDAMEAEHSAMHDQLAVLNGQFDELANGRSVNNEELLAQLDDLKVIVDGHCDHEERTGAKLAQKYVQSEDLKEFHTFTRSGPNSKIVFPWICDGATEADQKAAWGVLPGFVRVIAKPIMTRKYRAFVAEFD